MEDLGLRALYRRVAGIDVHRMLHVVTVLIEQADGSMQRQTREFGGFRRDCRALAALLFLYRQVLGVELPWLDEIAAAKDTQLLPVVLTAAAVRALLHELRGTVARVASLLYGTGMRLLEGLRLQVKDARLERRELLVRHGKGGKDRVTVLPENLMLPLRLHAGQGWRRAPRPA